VACLLKGSAYYFNSRGLIFFFFFAKASTYIAVVFSLLMLQLRVIIVPVFVL